MLEVPQKGTEKELIPQLPQPPCFRCIFTKPVSDSQCDPATCDMLSYWLMEGKNFDWDKHVGQWIIDADLKKYRKYELSGEFVDT